MTYDSYAAIAFGSGSVRSTWTLFADFMCAQIPKTWSACLFYLAMIWTSVYIIVFPTLASAMTSYGPISTALILTDMSSWDVWEPLWASISNGDDIGLPKGYAVRSLTAQGFNKTDERIHACKLLTLLHRTTPTELTAFKTTITTRTNTKLTKRPCTPKEGMAVPATRVIFSAASLPTRQLSLL